MNYARIKYLKALSAEPVPISISGTCMTPVLRDGQQTTFHRVRFYIPGDIIVFPQPGGKLVAHRLLGYYRKQGQWLMLAKGDNNRYFDRGIESDQVVGKIGQHSPSGTTRFLSVKCFLGFTIKHFLNVVRQKIPA